MCTVGGNVWHSWGHKKKQRAGCPYEWRGGRLLNKAWFIMSSVLRTTHSTSTGFRVVGTQILTPNLGPRQTVKLRPKTGWLRLWLRGLRIPAGQQQVPSIAGGNQVRSACSCRCPVCQRSHLTQECYDFTKKSKHHHYTLKLLGLELFSS